MVALLAGSEYLLLFFRMDPFADLLGDQGGVTPGAVVDDEIDLAHGLYGFVHDFCRVLDHLRIQHAGDHFVEWEGFGIGLFVVHPKRSDEPDHDLVFRIEKTRPHFGKLLPQRRQPGSQIRSDSKTRGE